MTICPLTRSRIEDAIVPLCMGLAPAMVAVPCVFVLSHHEAPFISSQAQTPVRAAQIAVYELLGVDRKIPPITPHDKSLRTQFEALIKAFK